MNNYWYAVDKEPNESFTLTIKVNSDIINIVEGFKEEDHAILYADPYIQGYKDARGEV